MNDKWSEYNSWNRRDLKMSQQWAEPLVQYVKDEISQLSEYDILDYGCGYFVLGYQLMDNVRSATGYDPYKMGLEIAKNSTQYSSKVILTSSLETVYKSNYDLILINSVIQYIDSLQEFQATLDRLRTHLKYPGKSMVIICDIIPKKYSAHLDGIENLVYAFSHGTGWQMLKHLRNVAIKGSQYTLLQIDPAELKDTMESLGFEVKFLKKNLTPSKRRYSVILS
jgi:hypothetical protein